MTELERLEEFAYQHNYLIHKEFIDSDKKGCCLTDYAIPVILLNKSAIDGSSDELCTLAEEIEHFETNTILPLSDYLNPNYNKWLKLKNEIIAKRGVIKKLIPLDRLRAVLITGRTEIWELAEFLNLPNEWIVMALEYYQGQGLLPRYNQSA